MANRIFSKVEGYRVGMRNTAEEYLEECLERKGELLNSLAIIHSAKYIRTKEKVCADEYNKTRKMLSDEEIIEKYNELKEEIGLTEVHKERII